MTDDLVSGPVAAPGRSRPVVGTKAIEDRHEPLPLIAEHIDQMLWIDFTLALGLQ
jgi:hypothetical protein